ncbi:ketopantoate reductase family protein [Hoeflea ulvae]|uniref:2-dehydropantoate 2-reductase n=1 Tax=Hoeflea ulvae TaxID=2983764 RepID=A0ABT3YD00_9HYPH|nr:2-dehydropantoate 2-reductase N-terminal domain-containing protein [Hoeflea ulvae]MCY0093759.1 NAD(P)-binding domain-containing protein [Hoeflea ulvae]
MADQGTRTQHGRSALQPVVIWGSGAIGGTIGAVLANAGRKVVFVDASEEHVRRIREQGLHVEGPVTTLSCRGDAVTPDQMTGQWPLILLAVKAHHTEQATRQLLPFLSDDGAVVSCQNGLNEPMIGDIVGPQRTIGAFVNFLADYIEPGRILYGGRGAVVVGEIDGSCTARVAALHDMLRLFEPDAVLTDDIYGYLWGKSAYGTLLKASAIADASIVDYITGAAYRGVLLAMIREVLTTAQAEGIRPRPFNGFEPAVFLNGDAEAVAASLEALRQYNAASTKTHSGVWRDLVKRKRQTDVAAQLNPVRAIAARNAIPTPLLDRLIELVEDVESGRRAVGPQTFAALNEVVPCK